MKKNIFLLILVFCFTVNNISRAENLKSELNWQSWNSNIFKEAKTEKKLVLLDLEAVWCHWCHVMHKNTYSDPKMQKILKEKYITVRVDQDSRPDLSNKYKKYGWPATIVFNADGKELIKRSGYIPPEEFSVELQRLAEKPEPEKTDEIDESKIDFQKMPSLSGMTRLELYKNYLETFDKEVGGLNTFQKYVDRDTVEFAIYLHMLKGREDLVATKTLNSGLMLIDPAWGGVYQYSTMGDWNYPHFEKLADIQGEYLRIYSLGYAEFKNSNYLNAAKSIAKYISDFLTSSEGAFYTSQDADLIQGEHSSEYFMLDDNARRKEGIPKIDKHIYSNFNGKIIEGLVTLYEVSGNKEYLDKAIKAASYIEKNRKISSGFAGAVKWIFQDFNPSVVFNKISWIISHWAWYEQGYRHDEKDLVGPFLCDSLYMGIAFLKLYEVTHDKNWLTKAEQVAHFISSNFTSPLPGYITSSASCKICAEANPTKKLDENISLVRFTTKLFTNTNVIDYRKMGENGMKYIGTQEIATNSITEPGILLAEQEFLQLYTKKS